MGLSSSRQQLPLFRWSRHQLRLSSPREQIGPSRSVPPLPSTPLGRCLP
jgi:hypothetical protein